MCLKAGCICLCLLRGGGNQSGSCFSFLIIKQSLIFFRQGLSGSGIMTPWGFCSCLCDILSFFETCPEAHPCGRCFWSSGCILAAKWSERNPLSLISSPTQRHTQLESARVLPQGLCVGSRLQSDTAERSFKCHHGCVERGPQKWL